MIHGIGGLAVDHRNTLNRAALAIFILNEDFLPSIPLSIVGHEPLEQLSVEVNGVNVDKAQESGGELID